jgi:hypothetical protein
MCIGQFWNPVLIAWKARICCYSPSTLRIHASNGSVVISAIKCSYPMGACICFSNPHGCSESCLIEKCTSRSLLSLCCRVLPAMKNICPMFLHLYVVFVDREDFVRAFMTDAHTFGASCMRLYVSCARVPVGHLLYIFLQSGPAQTCSHSCMPNC